MNLLRCHICSLPTPPYSIGYFTGSKVGELFFSIHKFPHILRNQIGWLHLGDIIRTTHPLLCGLLNYIAL